MAKGNDNESPVINIIGSGTVIKGEINATGDMRIDGTLIGSIFSKGKVVVGTTGNVEGEIICQNGDFSGTVKARVTVSEMLQLKSTGRLNGDLITGKLWVEPGAILNGTCNMQGGGINPGVIRETVNEKKSPATA